MTNNCLRQAIEKLDEEGVQKGYAFEDIVCAYYKQYYDTVLQTDDLYDKGIDIILFNEKSRLYRIGIQVKNHSNWVRDSAIIDMSNRSKDYYGLSELWLVSRNDVKYSARSIMEEKNIKLISNEEIQKMIDFANNADNIDTRDLRQKLFDVINEFNNENNIYFRLKKVTIDNILTKKPKTLGELFEIQGVGETIMIRYGEEIISLFK